MAHKRKTCKECGLRLTGFTQNRLPDWTPVPLWTYCPYCFYQKLDGDPPPPRYENVNLGISGLVTSDGEGRHYSHRFYPAQPRGSRTDRPRPAPDPRKQEPSDG